MNQPSIAYDTSSFFTSGKKQLAGEESKWKQFAAAIGPAMWPA